ncbi:MAG: PP0621 family protein [Gammaproteobacteria bacterium]
MGKILSWVLMALVGYLAWRLVGVIQRKAEAARRAQQGGTGAAESGQGAPKAIRDERIVPCAHCGVHFPASEAVEEGGRFYCSAAHRDADRAADRAA